MNTAWICWPKAVATITATYKGLSGTATYTVFTGGRGGVAPAGTGGLVGDRTPSVVLKEKKAIDASLVREGSILRGNGG